MLVYVKLSIDKRSYHDNYNKKFNYRNWLKQYCNYHLQFTELETLSS